MISKQSETCPFSNGSSIIGSSSFFPWKTARNLICWWYAPNFIYSHENMSYFSRYAVMPSFFAGKYFHLNWRVLVNHSHFQTAIASISTIIMFFILSSHFGWWIPLLLLVIYRLDEISQYMCIFHHFPICQTYWWFLQLPVFYNFLHSNYCIFNIYIYNLLPYFRCVNHYNWPKTIPIS